VEQFANNPTTTLAGAVTTTNGTTITVSSSAGFPSGGTFRVIIDGEIMKVTGISGVTWSVVRGDGGSTAATHTAGATVYGILTAEALNSIVSVQQAGTEVSNRRILNFVGASVSDDAANNRAIITAAGASYGAGASKPAAGQAGRIYVPSDGAIVSVDTGSAWVGLNPFGLPFTIPPTLSNWTAVNNSTNVITDIPGGGLLFTQPPQQNTNDMVACTRPISNTSSYTVTLAMQMFMWCNAFPYAGLCITDGTKFLTFVIGCPNTSGFDVHIFQWSTYSSNIGSAFSFGAPPYGYTPVVWLRITSDGVNRKYWISMNGVAWMQVYTEAATTFLTETAAGPAIRRYVATGGALIQVSYPSISGV
jgi:hypothetical protein